VESEVGVVRWPCVKHAVIGTRFGERGLAADARTGRQALLALHLVLEAVGLAAVLVCGVSENPQTPETGRQVATVA